MTTINRQIFPLIISQLNKCKEETNGPLNQYFNEGKYFVEDLLESTDIEDNFNDILNNLKDIDGGLRHSLSGMVSDLNEKNILKLEEGVTFTIPLSENKEAVIVLLGDDSEKYSSVVLPLLTKECVIWLDNLEVFEKVIIADTVKESNKSPYKKDYVEPDHRFTFYGEAKSDESDDKINRIFSLVEGMAMAISLGVMPANICTPPNLVQYIREEFDGSNDILCIEELDTDGMNLLEAVARGSEFEPVLLRIEYLGDKSSKEIHGLVGKGITYDTGGLSLKPSGYMDDMKYDMLGAATVAGTMKVLVENKAKINVVAYLPICENMLAGHSVKPGDVIESLNGITVEVNNTDAEGRLILADAITAMQNCYGDDLVSMIDVATLTGAIDICLSNIHTGLFTPSDKMAKKLTKAGKKSGDTVWRLPLGKEYSDSIKSDIADIKNTSSIRAGSSTAAAFLQEFVEVDQWAHLDIAATASGSSQTSVTGRPIKLLVEYFRKLENKK